MGYGILAFFPASLPVAAGFEEIFIGSGFVREKNKPTVRPPTPIPASNMRRLVFISGF